YRLLKGSTGGSSTVHLSLDGNSFASNIISVGGNTTLPMRIWVNKSPAQAIAANQYVGSFSGNFTYNITYP
ncbi:MAG: hypothetical protein ACRCTN_03910, partial [Carnobacterium maltaromaticum]